MIAPTIMIRNRTKTIPIEPNISWSIFRPKKTSGNSSGKNIMLLSNQTGAFIWKIGKAEKESNLASQNHFGAGHVP